MPLEVWGTGPGMSPKCHPGFCTSLYELLPGLHTRSVLHEPCTPRTAYSGFAPQGNLYPQGPHTRSSYSSSTSISSRDCDWEVLRGLRHGWTSREACLPPLALCAEEERAVSTSTLEFTGPSVSAQLPVSPRLYLEPQGSRNPRNGWCLPVSQPHVGWAWVSGGGCPDSVVPALDPHCSIGSWQI